MLRVLHLLDHNADFQTRYLAQALSNKTTRLFFRPGARGIWNAMRLLNRQLVPDIVHAWGRQALLAAAIANIAPIVFSPPTETTRADWNWLRRISKYRDVRTIFSSPMRQLEAKRHGTASDKDSVIPPGLAPIECQRNDKLRKQLGFCADDFVILAPGESTPAAGHRLALWTVAILRELDPTWKLLIWGRGKSAGDLQSLARRLGHLRLVRFARDWEFESLLSVPDAALIMSDPTAATIPVALCMAAGIPIATTSDLFTDRRNALRVTNESPRRLAQRLLELRTNPALSRSLAAAARIDAAKIFNLDEFLQRHRNLYLETGASAKAKGEPWKSQASLGNSR